MRQKASADRRSAPLHWLSTCFWQPVGTILGVSVLMDAVWFNSNDEIFANPLDLIQSNFAETFLLKPSTARRLAWPYRFNENFKRGFVASPASRSLNSASFAYALTQLKFRSKTVLYFIVMGCYMLPGAVTYIPSYITL
ncbi:hypothetical protein OK016_29905 [Vibrio chagasii]|nr:hypothetical protein [Vibrio chagasii]